MFVACGLNHITAPLQMRETIAVNDYGQWLQKFINNSSVAEAIIVSTCNRTEIYCEIEDPKELLSLVAQTYNLSIEAIKPYFYQYHDYHGIHPLLRVACGLDSMMLGEPQILGQIKNAYQQGCEHHSVQQRLKNIFQYIFRMSKKIRHTSGINNHPISVSFAAVQLIAKLFNAQQSLNILIIGAGETSSLVGKYLCKQNKHKFMVANRTPEHAEELAHLLSGQALSIMNLTDYLPQADVVITATACPIPFITQTLIERAMEQRNHANMFLLDLAVPRNIESNVKLINHVTLYNIDDLHGKIDQGVQERKTAAIYAEELVENAIEIYRRKHRERQANDIICNYREHTHAIATKELQRALKRLDSGKSQYDVLNEFSTRLIKKFTHIPTIGLKQAALDNREDLLQLVQYLFTESTQ